MKRIVLLPVAALFLGGCVSAGKYKSAVEETQALQSQITSCQGEQESLRASCAAKAKEAADKADGLQKQIDGLQKQAKDLGDQVAALQKAQADLTQENKDLKKVSDLLKADNDRLDKALADRKAEYAKAVAKLKAVVDEMAALDAPGGTGGPSK